MKTVLVILVSILLTLLEIAILIVLAAPRAVARWIRVRFARASQRVTGAIRRVRSAPDGLGRQQQEHQQPGSGAAR